VISDEAIALLVALEDVGVIASGMDYEGVAITLHGITVLEERGWKITPPETDEGSASLR
jgi:hypothetical protein